MLFDVDRVSEERLVGIYRVLGEVDAPEHYARRLAEALHTTGYIFGRHGADAALTLGRLEEAIELSRGLDSAEHRDRDALLKGILATYQWALYRYGRRADGLATRREILALTRAGTGDRWALAAAILEVAVGLAEDGHDDDAEALFAEAAAGTVGLARGYRPVADRHWYLTAHAAHLAARGRHTEAADAYRPLLDTTHEDRQVPILLYGARLLAAAKLPAESRDVQERAVETYRRQAVRQPTRVLRHDHLAFHLALAGARDEPPGTAHGTTPDHWSPEHRDRYDDAVPAIRAALDDPATTPAERVVLARRLTVRATFAELPREAVTDRLLPAYAEAVTNTRALAAHDPVGAAPLLARALTDHALLLASIGRARDGITDMEEAAALHG